MKVNDVTCKPCNDNVHCCSHCHSQCIYWLNAVLEKNWQYFRNKWVELFSEVLCEFKLLLTWIWLPFWLRWFFLLRLSMLLLRWLLRWLFLLFFLCLILFFQYVFSALRQILPFEWGILLILISFHVLLVFLVFQGFKFYSLNFMSSPTFIKRFLSIIWNYTSLLLTSLLEWRWRLLALMFLVNINRVCCSSG